MIGWPPITGSIRFAGDLHPAWVIGFALVTAVSGRLVVFARDPHRCLALQFRAARACELPPWRLAILILAAPVWHRRVTVGTLGPSHLCRRHVSEHVDE